MVSVGDVNWQCRNRWVVADGTSKRSKISEWCTYGEQFYKSVGCSRERMGRWVEKEGKGPSESKGFRKDMELSEDSGKLHGGGGVLSVVGMYGDQYIRCGRCPNDLCGDLVREWKRKQRDVVAIDVIAPDHWKVDAE